MTPIQAGTRWTLLRERRYLTVWLAGALVNINLWLEMLAIGVFVFDVTDSPFQVALMLCLRMLPLALLGALVGALAERFAKSRMLLVGMGLMVVTSLVLGFLVATERIEVWHLGLGSFLGGVFWTLDLAVRRTLVGDFAGPSRVGMAMSLDTMTGNGTRVIGPLLGGLLLAAIGLNGAFFLGAGLYLLAMVALASLPAEAAVDVARKPHVIRSMLEGFRYIRKNRPLTAVLMVTLVFNLWGFPFMSMVPVIGRDTLGLGAFSVGMLAASEGVGAFLGGLVIAAVAPMSHFRRIFVFGFAALLVMVLVFAQSTWVILSGVCLFAGGLAGAGYAAMQSTLIYLNSPPEMRARMMGVMSVFIGIAPIGFLHVGLMADVLGAPATVTIISLEGLVALLFVYLRWPLLSERQPHPDELGIQ